MNDQTRELDALAAELLFARRKFPRARLFVEALCEELGEAAREPAPGAPGNREWLQVACVAMRLYSEGSPDLTTASPTLALLRGLEPIARERLVAGGAS